MFENFKAKFNKFSEEYREYTRANIEDSIILRVLVTITILIAVVSTGLVLENGLVIILSASILTLVGSYISYSRRYSKNWWIKLIISLLMLVVFGDFLRNAAMNPYDARMPLTILLIWLQTLHSFDLPTRKDLGYTLLVALVLICVTATISREMVFGIFLFTFIISGLLSLLYENLAQHKIQRLNINSKSFLKLGISTLIITLIGMFVAFAFIPRSQTIKIRSLPMSMRLPEIPAFKGEIKSKTRREIENQGSNGGFKIKRIFDSNAYYGFSTELDLNFRGKLSDEIVLKVRSPEARYWRGMAFDLYDGKEWKMSEPFKLKKAWARNPQMFLRMSETVKKDITPKKELIQTFYIEKEQSNLVFSSPYVEQLYFPSEYVMIDEYGSIRSPSELAQGLTYSVISYVPIHNIQKIRELKLSHPVAQASKNYYQRPQISERVINLTREITKSAKSDIDKVILLENYLQKNYIYNLDTPEFPENVESIDYFLFERKEGYCEHFATSLAIMTRILNIPTRLATGFTSGKYNYVTGYYEVKSSDAHAWVEVYFPHFGWVDFDPTPGYTANFGNGSKSENIVASALTKKLLAWLNKIIPQAFSAHIKDFIITVIIGLVTFFASIMKFFLELNWLNFVILIFSSVIIVAIFVLSITLFKNIQTKRNKELSQRKKFKSLNQIEIIKLQEKLIKLLEKQGYIYSSESTLKEYLSKISNDKLEIMDILNKITDKFYYSRYSDTTITTENIEECKELVNEIIKSCKK